MKPQTGKNISNLAQKRVQMEPLPLSARWKMWYNNYMQNILL